MMEKQRKKYSTLALYGRLILQARAYWPHVVAFLLLSLLSTPLALLAPLPLAIAIGSVTGENAPPRFLQPLLPSDGSPSAGVVIALAAGMVVAITVLTQLQQLISQMLKAYVAEKLVMDFRSRLFSHCQQLSLAYHDRKGATDSIYRIQGDAPAINHIVLDSVIPLISALVMLGGMLYVTSRLSPRLAIVAIAICPPLLLVTAFFRRRLRRQWHDVKQLESSTQSVIHEVLGAVRVVKAFTRERHEHARFERHARISAGARLWVAFQENLYSMLVALLTAIGTAAVLYIGFSDVRAGALSLANLVVVMAYLGKLYDPLKTLGKQLATRERSMASAERAFALLDEAAEVPEHPHARPLERAVGAVSFRHVSFSYPGAAQAALQDICVDVPAGTRVGIAGKTGAGKTTLINLLGRFYDPTSGAVLLDGRDLREYRLADLRNQFSIVLQEPVLFSTTIAENIAYGRSSATEQEIIAAAKAANAHEFIEALEEGYQTQVGERGMCLSGGERQRISLARAFLKDGPILILDEPTSSVDVKTEAQIMVAMERLMRGRTSFLIAHRLSTLDSCELLLRIEAGRLVESTPRGAHVDRPDLVKA